jgi:hypothetical protein
MSAGEPVDAVERSVLEARYRRLLRLLPRGYRALREEEMVGTFLTTMYDGDPENYDLTLKHGRPSGAEMRAIAALAVRLRWGESVAPERFAVRAAAARAFLLTGVTVAWAYAVAQLIGIVLVFALDPPPEGGQSLVDLYRQAFAVPAGSWAWWSTWAYVGWAAALPLLVFGGRTAARWAAVCAAVPVAAEVIGWVRDPVPLGIGIARAPDLLVDLAMLGLLATVAMRPAAGVAGSLVTRPWRFLWAGCGMVAVLWAYTAVVWWSPGLWDATGLGATLFRSAGWWFSFTAGWWALAAVGCGIGLLIYRGRAADPVRAAGSATGCALIAGVATALSAASAAAMPAASPVEYGTTFVATSAAQIGVAGGIFVIAVIVAARRLRALPLGRYAGADR